MNINNLLITACVLIASFQATASTEAFSEAKFEQVLKEKGTVVVAFHSDSCGSCKIQKPNLEAVLTEVPLQNITGLMANFESTSEFRKKLDKPVRSPSTYLIFKDGKEVTRIQGETNKDKIRESISKSISQK